MAKKRKASAPARTGPKELDPADARLGPITTYEDVADSEDEYFMNRDKIMFDEQPKSKRRKRDEEEDKFLEHSDEEVLDFDDGDDSEEEERKAELKKAKKAAKKGQAAAESDEEEEGEGDEADPSWWGSSKKEYYNADQIETEADALEEEAEAKRLQQKKLAKMSEEDFLFDEGEWLASKPDEAEDQEIVTEVLKDIEITDDMGPEERRKMLQSRYPEFEHLVNEFQELQPQLVTLQKEAHGKSSQSLEAVKYWILGCYVAALASYFAILTSPSRDGSSTQKTLDPAELRDHEVMETLLECREAWQQVKAVRPAAPVDSMDVSEEEAAIPEEDEDDAAIAAAREEARRLRKLEKASKAKKKQAQAVEDSLKDLDDLLKPSKKTKKAKKAAKTTADEDDNSDFGEEEVLDARTAADKAARKKSLRFYTSQIVQKANRRTDAGRDAGGDHDLPYRERLRDRQARLNAEAERRGQKGSKYGADLGDEGSGDEDDARTAAALRGDGDDEYYDMVAAKSKKKKEENKAYYDALKAAGKADRVVEQEVVGADGKRKITYAIEKNKGLTPKRKKENRNPRVKKKMQYAEKQKKLRSMKAQWKGGEPKGGYGGEMSGITTSIVRARKL
ncbi:something about silencing protein 10 [Colletotrichum tropicale]|nr:something about silencing protein 10 [Colletotrichum tropicale]